MRTEDVSQLLSGWLNFLQLANIHVILVTLETFHSPISAFVTRLGGRPLVVAPFPSLLGYASTPVPSLLVLAAC